MLDSSDDIMSAALHYLDLDPNSSDPGRSAKSRGADAKIRPYVRKFHSSEYLNALATGEICLVVGFSGDIKQAQKRAAEAKGGVADRLFDPERGRAIVVRQFRHPEGCAAIADEAHALINYLLKPGSGGEELRTSSPTPTAIWRARNSSTSRSSTTAPIYPDDATMAKLYTITAHDQKTQRLINRLWTRIKTGR